MKKSLAFTVMVFLCSAAFIVSCNEKNGSDTAATTNSITNLADSSTAFTAEQAEHGKYLVGIMGCSDCHTPMKMGESGPEPDMNRYLSGYPSAIPLPPVDSNAVKNWILMSYTTAAFVGPWGTSYAANLTSDETGIGNWTLGQFKKALKEGKWKGMDNSRTLLPPMPWQNFKNIKDEDIRDMFAYLKSTKPVKNIEPAAQPPLGM